MERPPEELTDGVVRLRRWRTEDAAAVHAEVNRSLDHLSPWMPWASEGYPESAAAEFVRRSHQGWNSGEEFWYAILSPEGELAGSCGLMTRIGAGGLEIGYWLGHGHTGRGLAGRAAAVLTDVAFDLGALRVEIHHDELNLASRRIPERLGFTRVERARLNHPPSRAGSGYGIVWRRTRPAGG